MALPAGGGGVLQVSEWHHFHLPLSPRGKKKNVSERGSRKDVLVKRLLNDAVWLVICASKMQ